MNGSSVIIPSHLTEYVDLISPGPPGSPDVGCFDYFTEGECPKALWNSDNPWEDCNDKGQVSLDEVS